MNTNERIRQLRIECDNYHRALEALKALGHELLWDSANKVCTPGGIAHFGRRMHTTPGNRIAPARKVTPDLVGQKSPNSGFVVELKASVPENEIYRREKLRQVQKYDDDLTGWKTAVNQHDVILLVDYSNSVVVRQDIEAMLGNGEMTCQRPFAIVYFNHTQRAEDTWIALHLVHGRLSEVAKQQTLERICQIHPENVAANPLFGHVKIYDARPPLPLLMLRLYEAINSNLSEEEQLQLLTEGQVTRTYRLAELKDMLAESCCPEQTDPRVPNLPETAWIKAALRMWVKLGWAIKSPNAPKCFDVIVKARRQPFEQFLRVCADEDCKEERKREREQERKRVLDEKYRDKYPLLALAETAEARKGGKGASLIGSALEQA